MTFAMDESLIYDKGALNQSMPPQKQRLYNQRLQQIFEKSKVTGISIAAFKINEGKWLGTEGFADVENKDLVEAGSKFHAGSIGKVFTAVLVFQLIEDGRLALDATIDQWFPKFPNANKITIDHLLTHTSGIYSFNWSKKFRESSKYHTPPELIAEAKKQGNHFRPGERWSYSNTGYVMLAVILEKITQQTFFDLLKKRIIEPLELKNTGIITPENEHALLIKGYHRGESIMSKVNHATPHGAGIIASNASDLATFFYALLARKLVSGESLEAMTSQMYPMGTGITFYGRGIILMRSPLGDMLYFAGRIAGFGAMVGYLVEQETFVAVMVNDETQVDPAWYALLKK